HPLHAADDLQQRREDPQVAGDWRLARKQHQNAVVHLHVTLVDLRVIGEHHASQLSVLLVDRLERPSELLGDEIKATQSLTLEPLESYPELAGSLVLRISV